MADVHQYYTVYHDEDDRSVDSWTGPLALKSIAGRCRCGWRGQRRPDTAESGVLAFNEWWSEHYTPLVRPDPGELLILSNEGGERRHFLAGRPVHSGMIIELLLSRGHWVPVRYEWSARTDAAPRFYVELGGPWELVDEHGPETYLLVPLERAVFRWPGTTAGAAQEASARQEPEPERAPEGLGDAALGMDDAQRAPIGPLGGPILPDPPGYDIRDTGTFEAVTPVNGSRVFDSVASASLGDDPPSPDAHPASGATNGNGAYSLGFATSTGYDAFSGDNGYGTGNGYSANGYGANGYGHVDLAHQAGAGGYDQDGYGGGSGHTGQASYSAEQDSAADAGGGFYASPSGGAADYGLGTSDYRSGDHPTAAPSTGDYSTGDYPPGNYDLMPGAGPYATGATGGRSTGGYGADSGATGTYGYQAAQGAADSGATGTYGYQAAQGAADFSAAGATGFGAAGSTGADGGYGYGADSTGGYPAAEYPTGDYSTGDYPSGDHRTAQPGTGDYDAKGYATGSYDAGSYDARDYGTGDYGTGDYDARDYGTGDFRSGDHASGGGGLQEPTAAYGADTTGDLGYGSGGYGAGGEDRTEAEAGAAAGTRAFGAFQEPLVDPFQGMFGDRDGRSLNRRMGKPLPGNWGDR